MKRSLVLAGASAVLVVSTTGTGCCLFSVPRYLGPSSDHFNGTVFHNEIASRKPRRSALLRWQLDRHPGEWKSWTDTEPGAPPPPRVEGDGMRVTFVNHATTLIQMNGLNILTDPIWSERCSPFSWVGPKRVRPPGIRFEDLPPIDIVLISHNHYDHMDLPTVHRLADKHHPRFFVGLGNKAFLESEGIDKVSELDWWQSTELAPGVKLTAVPAQHFSNRSLCDARRALWTGFAVAGPSGTAYFAGDTGLGPHFAEIHERIGPIRLAILPIGAYKPEWFMHAVHMSPADALRAHEILRSSTSVAMHFGTFQLGDDGQDDAPRDLAKALAEAGQPEPRFWVLGFGEGRDVPADTNRPLRLSP